MEASATYFPTLGVRPLVGRTFEEEEDRPGGAPVVVLGEDLARKLFGSPAAALGQSLQINSDPTTVVGVMPRTFRVEGHPELWVPVGPRMVGHAADRGNHPGLMAVARLTKGVSFAEGRLDLESVGSALQAEARQLGIPIVDNAAFVTALAARHAVGDTIVPELFQVAAETLVTAGFS